jgi:ribosomal protein L23
MNRAGRFAGNRSHWKKAFVTLAQGDKIDVFDVV